MADTKIHRTGIFFVCPRLEVSFILSIFVSFRRYDLVSLWNTAQNAACRHHSVFTLFAAGSCSSTSFTEGFVVVEVCGACTTTYVLPEPESAADATTEDAPPPPPLPTCLMTPTGALKEIREDEDAKDAVDDEEEAADEEDEEEQTWLPLPTLLLFAEGSSAFSADGDGTSRVVTISAAATSSSAAVAAVAATVAVDVATRMTLGPKLVCSSTRSFTDGVVIESALLLLIVVLVGME